MRALGLDPSRVVDFAVNVSPFGPHPDVIAAARGADLARYPERDGKSARQAIARALDASPDTIALGNGSAELLFSIAYALTPPGERCLVLAPTFGEARAAFEAARGDVIEHLTPLEAEHDLDAVTRTLAEVLARSSPHVAYLCDPNNPSGRLLGAARVAALADASPQTTLILDQAFLSLSEGHASTRARLPDNVVVLRSLTKDHALPGLRIGYAIAHPELIARVERARPPWTTSAAAQAVVPVALAHAAHVDEARRRLLELRRALERGLRELGLAPHPSSTPYVLVEVGDAEGVRARLLREHGVLVRSCVSFGLPRHIRVCARPLEDQARLLAALSNEHERRTR